MLVNNNQHPKELKECFSKYLKQCSGFHTCLGFDGLTCTQVLNYVIYVNIPHNKLQRKILLDITVRKQCTFHVNNSNLNIHYSGEIPGECLFKGITIQLCPSSNPILGAKPPLLLDTWWLYMHACSEKGRRLENKKFKRRDGIKRKEKR